MKRMLAILLSVLMMMCSVPMAVAADDAASIVTDPTFAVSQAVGKRGETVKVAISALNNPGISSTKVKIYYDPTVLKLVSYEDGDFSEDGYSYGLENNIPFVINWCYPLGKDSTAGLLATLTFAVLDDAAFGAAPIDITFSCEDDVYNMAWETVDFAPLSGEVYVLYPVTGVKLDKSVLNLYNGDSATLNATVLAEGKTDETVIWSSNNTAVATVDENGVVTAVGLGSAEIFATTAEGGFVASCAVNVTCAHRNTVDVERVDSSCIVQGHDAYTRCDDCGVIVAGSDALLPLANHTYKAVVTAPDCENGGYTTYTCSVCGDSYVADKTDALGHTYDNACDVDCNRCGAVRTITHDYKAVVTAPDCENGGYTTYTCSVCGDSYVADKTDALGHTYDNACDVDCNRCGAVRTITHDYKAVVTAPDCENGGYTTYTCSVCGDSYVADKTAPTGHIYDDEYDTDCNVCGAIRDMNPKLGDVNGDRDITNRDISLLQQYLNGWGVTIYENAANVYRTDEDEGEVLLNNRDLGLLMQYINGWDVELG